MANEPIEWKSAAWWRNRPVDERLSWLHIPKRIAEVTGKCLLGPYEDGANYLITGPSQTGKSITASATLQNIVRGGGAQAGPSGRWVPADDYVEWIKDSFNNDGEMPIEYSSPYLIKNIKAVFDVIVLDGLGEERQTDFARHELGSLIRKRFDDLRTTIITTRLPVRDLIDIYGSRIEGALDSYQVEVGKRGR